MERNSILTPWPGFRYDKKGTRKGEVRRLWVPFATLVPVSLCGLLAAGSPILPKLTGVFRISTLGRMVLIAVVSIVFGLAHLAATRFGDGGAVIVAEACFLLLVAYAAIRHTRRSSGRERWVSGGVAAACLAGVFELGRFAWHVVERFEPFA